MRFRHAWSPLPIGSIRLKDSIWATRQRYLARITLKSEFGHILTTGRLANFERVGTGAKGGHRGRYYDDSDVYKWLEAAAYAQVLDPCDEVEKMAGRAIEAIEKAQSPDGYINTYFQLEHPDLRWRNLSMLHEMYCGGHLIEAGVAWFEARGSRKLLDVAIRFADHVLDLFGPSGRVGFCGHQEIEWALIRLASATGNSAYRDLARRMVDSRGNRPSPFEAELDDPEARSLSPWGATRTTTAGKYTGEYLQDHLPLRDQSAVVGHAVRAMYFFMAATDLATDVDDPALETALLRLWENLTERRMYVTGGIGPAAENEGFTVDYDLPNRSAYAETCASIGLVMWARRLAMATGESQFMDVAERALYNGVLSGISLSGDRFFYDNPSESRFEHSREPWFSCACCPPNVARLFGAMSDYIAGAADDNFFVHIPASFEAAWQVSGSQVSISLVSDYPWEGRYSVVVRCKKPTRFTLRLRIPEWSEDCEMELPEGSEPAEFENGYAVIARTWSDGESVKVDLNMTPLWLRSNDRVLENAGRAALGCGPLVYCAEATDHARAPQRILADLDRDPTPAEAPIGLEHHVAKSWSIEGWLLEPSDDPRLYFTCGPPDLSPAGIVMVPYFSWANRGKSAMQVWLAVR